MASPHRTIATSRTSPTTTAQNATFTRNNSRVGLPRRKTSLRTAADGRSTPLVLRWTLFGFILPRMLTTAQNPSSELYLTSLMHARRQLHLPLGLRSGQRSALDLAGLATLHRPSIRPQSTHSRCQSSGRHIPCRCQGQRRHSACCSVRSPAHPPMLASLPSPREAAPHTHALLTP